MRTKKEILTEHKDYLYNTGLQKAVTWKEFKMTLEMIILYPFQVLELLLGPPLILLSIVVFNLPKIVGIWGTLIYGIVMLYALVILVFKKISKISRRIMAISKTPS